MAADHNYSSMTERGNLSFSRVMAFPVTTTETNILVIDSGALGLHSVSITLKNTHASVAINLDVYVSNDKGESSGWLNLANAYDEADVSVALPLAIAAGATDHIILGYKNQPQYTLFRYWRFTVATGANTSTCNIYAQGR
jgi:hypothetical protein